MAETIEKALSGTEKFFNQILSHIPISILVFDPSLKVVFVNDNYLEKARLRRENVINKELKDIFPSVLLGYTRLPELLKEVFTAGHSLPGQEMVYRAPGIPYRVYYYRLSALQEAKVIENVMLLIEDITEQTKLREKVRKTESHLASVVESANDIVVSMDPNGTITTWNTAGEKITGFGLLELVGNHLSALCSTDNAEDVRRVLNDTIRREKVRHLEVEIIDKKGKVIPVAWNFSSMRDEKERVVGLVGIGRDLTETKQLQAQLFQSDKLASLGVLAGGIAHEIRNPLGVSSAAAQLFLERPDDPQLLEECAQKIHSGIQRASEIIERLLQFARPTTRRSEPTNINQILEEALDLTSKQLVHQHISVQKEFHGAVPLINADGKLLKQVFLNIILNASNAMSGGGRLWIKTSVEKKQQPHQIEITFKDSGPGIPKEDMDKVFDPFFTTMPVGEGTGLGLSICYGIIKEHGGTIRVESNLGRGSVFIITLPLIKSEL